MKNQKVRRGLVVGLCMLALTGCGAGAKMHSDQKDNIDSKAGDADGNASREDKDDSMPDGKDASGAGTWQEDQNDVTANVADGKVDAGSLYTSATMRGSVVEFSEDGCTVSMATTEDDGKTSAIAAPGHENKDENIVVTYQEGCVVQIATIHTSTGVAELEQASVSDIKKQASVIVYGSFEDEHHVSATKIIICHMTA